MPRRLAHPLSVLALAGALVLAACGDDEPDPGAGTAADTTASAEAPQSGSAEAPTQIGGGVTTLKLDGTVEDVLGVAGVKLSPTGDAARGAGGLRFPITGGELDLGAPSGRLEHDGGLRFSAAGQSIDATDLVIEPGRGVMTAEVAGRRLPLMTLDLGRPRAPETGGAIVWGASAGVSDDAAAAINDRLGVDVLQGGIELGDLIIGAERG